MGVDWRFSFEEIPVRFVVEEIPKWRQWYINSIQPFLDIIEYPNWKWRANMWEAVVGEMYVKEGEDKVIQVMNPLWNYLSHLIQHYKIV
jgi:hypothetical protein